MTYKLLDLFSGAGGAARGYQLAGFHVTGVDNRPQPRYCGDAFIQADALEYVAEHGREFDAIHASPPCQLWSRVGNHSRRAGKIYPDYISPIRPHLFALGKPFIIENVVGAPLVDPLLLCGSMFDPPLNVRRHRLFEVGFPIEPPIWPCRHALMGPRFEVYEHYKKRLTSTVRVNGGYTKGAAEAMQINWRTHKELVESIPPAYTEFIGRVLMQVLEHGR